MSTDIMHKWDSVAEPWVQKWTKLRAWQMKERKDFARLCKDGFVLDLGCGNGRDIQIFSNLGLRCIGLDFSSKMLTLAKQKTMLIRGDVRKIPFKANSFDGVWSCSVLKYLPIDGVLKSLMEIHRVLKEKGYFWVSLDRGQGIKSDKRCGVEMKMCLFTENDFSHLVEKSRFQLIDVKRFKAWRNFINFVLQK